jgi:hypothetical protein
MVNCFRAGTKATFSHQPLGNFGIGSACMFFSMVAGEQLRLLRRSRSLWLANSCRTPALSPFDSQPQRQNDIMPAAKNYSFALQRLCLKE